MSKVLIHLKKSISHHTHIRVAYCGAERDLYCKELPRFTMKPLRATCKDCLWEWLKERKGYTRRVQEWLMQL